MICFLADSSLVPVGPASRVPSVVVMGSCLVRLAKMADVFSADDERIAVLNYLQIVKGRGIRSSPCVPISAFFRSSGKHQFYRAFSDSAEHFSGDLCGTRLPMHPTPLWGRTQICEFHRGAY